LILNKNTSLDDRPYCVKTTKLQLSKHVDLVHDIETTWVVVIRNNKQMIKNPSTILRDIKNICKMSIL
jgi:hypothetical protein